MQSIIFGLILTSSYTSALSATSEPVEYRIVRCRIRDGHTGGYSGNYTNGFVDQTTGKCSYFIGQICGGAEDSCPTSSECIESLFDRSYKACTCSEPIHVATTNLTSCIRGAPIGAPCDAPDGTRQGTTTKCNDKYAICSHGICICDPRKSVHASAEFPNECQLTIDPAPGAIQSPTAFEKCRIGYAPPGSWKENVTNGFIDHTTGKCIYFIGEICDEAKESCPVNSVCIQSRTDRNEKYCTCSKPVHVATVNKTSCIRGIPIEVPCDAPEGKREGRTTKCIDKYGICSNGICSCDPTVSVHASAETPHECKLKVGQPCMYFQGEKCTGYCEISPNASIRDPGTCVCPRTKSPSATGFCVSTPAPYPQSSTSLEKCRIIDGHSGQWQNGYTNGFVDRTTGNCTYFVGTICGGAESSCPADTTCVRTPPGYPYCDCKQPGYVHTVDKTKCTRGVAIGGPCDGAEGAREGPTSKCNDNYGICINGTCVCDPTKSLHVSAAELECRLKVGQVCNYWNRDCTGICKKSKEADVNDLGICECDSHEVPSSSGFCINPVA